MPRHTFVNEPSFANRQQVPGLQGAVPFFYFFWARMGTAKNDAPLPDPEIEIQQSLLLGNTMRKTCPTTLWSATRLNKDYVKRPLYAGFEPATNSLQRQVSLKL